MRVVALVSGGKDSTYAMMKCVEHGHTIVALANLYPPAGCGEEMDSFMYQTVGHAHIDAIAQAMTLPLFRREIKGGSLNQALQYQKTDGDEVEDLHALLAEVCRELPEVDAVCAGAILSNYQRSRVEAVCERLGLTSLAYLWQREQAPLLAEMVQQGVSAILVKVASLGLTQAHLGRTIEDLQPTFLKLNERFGFHVCGEGGEYETFTLDSPLFKRRIEPISTSVIRHSADVALLSFESVALRDKDRVDLVDEHPIELGSDSRLDYGIDIVHRMSTLATACTLHEPNWQISRHDASSTIAASGHVGCVVAALGDDLIHASVYGPLEKEGSSSSQLMTALSHLASGLHEYRMELDHILQLRLYVADMREYASINAAFSAFFNGHAPAARIAIQLPLRTGLGCALAIECIAWRGAKRLLHVRSLSEWAPRMIGPYCQLTVGHGMCFVAGSLGLVPPSMKLVEGGFHAQAELALRNCAAVLIGLSMRAADAFALVMYTTCEAHVADTFHMSNEWLKVVTDRPGASANDLPLVLVLQVGALPLGALVEAQLEVCETARPAQFRSHWSTSSVASTSMTCDAIVTGSVDGSAAGIAMLLVTADDGITMTMRDVSDASLKAVEELSSQLRAHCSSWQMGRSIYARVLYDKALNIPVAELGATMSATLAECNWTCAVFAVPVERVHCPSGRTRVAIQVHFIVTTAGAGGGAGSH